MLKRVCSKTIDPMDESSASEYSGMTTWLRPLLGETVPVVNAKPMIFACKNSNLRKLCCAWVNLSTLVTLQSH